MPEDAHSDPLARRLDRSDEARVGPVAAHATMPDRARKVIENVAGRFYVDETCIDCDLCRETAPANFVRQDSDGHSYVVKQPESPAEEALCQAAMEECPVEAIGNDGVSRR